MDKDSIFSHAYIWMYNHNGESNSNPYHNEKHVLFVFDTALNIFDKYRKEYDEKREDFLKENKGCIFVRIEQKDFLKDVEKNIIKIVNNINDIINLKTINNVKNFNNKYG